MNNKVTLKTIIVSVIIQLFAGGIVYGAVVTRGYSTKELLPAGTVVSLEKKGSNTIEKATTDNELLIAGVVTGAEDSLLDLQPEGSVVRVATEGGLNVLAATVNGDINNGDKLILSPLAGIMAKDNPDMKNGKYLGVSTGTLNDQSPGAKQIEVDQSNGDKKKVTIGQISAKLMISERKPTISSASTDGNNPVTRLAKQITGKSVSMAKIIASMVVLVTTLTITGVLLYSSIRGTFTSLGRNPLARNSLMTGLVRVIIVSVLVLAGGGVASYTILTL